MCKCQKCEHYDMDYVWDGEDEWPIDICEAGYDEYLDADEECPYYKRYRERKYVEEDTECNKCEYLSECIENGEYIDCTTMEDTGIHVMCSMENCRKRMGT